MHQLVFLMSLELTDDAPASWTLELLSACLSLPVFSCFWRRRRSNIPPGPPRDTDSEVGSDITAAVSTWCCCTSGTSLMKDTRGIFLQQTSEMRAFMVLLDGVHEAACCAKTESKKCAES